MNEDYKNRGMDLKRFTLYFQKKIWIILLLILVGGNDRCDLVPDDPDHEDAGGI